MHSKGLDSYRARVEELEKDAAAKDVKIQRLETDVQVAAAKNVEFRSALLSAEQLVKQRDEEIQVLLSEMESLESSHRKKLETLEECFKSVAQH